MKKVLYVAILGMLLLSASAKNTPAWYDSITSTDVLIADKWTMVKTFTEMHDGVVTLNDGIFTADATQMLHVSGSCFLKHRVFVTLRIGQHFFEANARTISFDTLVRGSFAIELYQGFKSKTSIANPVFCSVLVEPI